MTEIRNISLRFVLWAFSIALFSNVHAQVCINGVSTHPLNPTNADPNYAYSNNLWLNTFDFGLNNGSSFSDVFLNPSAGWYIPDFTASAQFQMLSPFTNGGAPGTPHLSQVVPFQNRDFHWEDGWELLYLGIGYYPNGHPLNVAPSNAPMFTPAAAYDGRIPYMVYYNRYNGLIRLFAGLFTPFDAVKSLTVDLTMNNGNPAASPPEIYTGIFRHLAKYDSPLDQPSRFRAQRGVNATGFDAGTSFNHRVWYVYDFQVGFDPCTCYSPSELNFIFRTVQSSTLSLYGRMITLEEDLVDNDGNVTYNQDFLTASSIENQDPNGYIMRSSLDGLVEDYRESLRIYNEQLEDRKFGNNGWFRNVLSDFQSTIVGAAVDLVPGGEIAEWLIDKKMNLGADTSDVEKLVKSASKAAIGSGYDFLSNQIFGENVEPVRPSRPVASFSEMRFSGGITSTNSSSLLGFWTPGSDYSGNDWTAHNYPAYNEILGLYATLKTPEVLFNNDLTTVFTDVISTVVDFDSTWSIGSFPNPCFVNSSGYHLDSTVWKSKSIIQDLQFKLKEPLSYSLNQAIDFNPNRTKIYMSYSITLENANPVSPVNEWSSYQLIDSLIVVENGNTNLFLMHDIPKNVSPNHKKAQRRIDLAGGWREVENVANLLLGSELETSIFYREEYSTFTPVCGDNGNTDVKVPTINPAGLEFRPVKIELKIMADMYFDQLSYTGEEINTTQVFTYLLLDTDQGIDLIDDQGNYVLPSESDDFIMMFPGQLTIESPELWSGSPEAYPSTENFTVFVRAEDIIIDVPTRSIQVMGVQQPVKIQAYDQIHLKPGAHLRPNLHLEINKDIYGVAPSLPATQAEIGTFCSTPTYQAGVFNSARVASELADDELFEATNSLEANNKVALYPNPANGAIQLRSSDLGISRVDVFDIAGRLMLQRNYGAGGGKEVQMEIQNLQTGVYFVHINCRGQIHKEKLVVGR